MGDWSSLASGRFFLRVFFASFFFFCAARGTSSPAWWPTWTRCRATCCWSTAWSMRHRGPLPHSVSWGYGRWVGSPVAGVSSKNSMFHSGSRSRFWLVGLHDPHSGLRGGLQCCVPIGDAKGRWEVEIFKIWLSDPPPTRGPISIFSNQFCLFPKIKQQKQVCFHPTKR